MSEEQIRAMVITNIIDNCTIELDNTGQERYSLDRKQFGDIVKTLVKNIKAIHVVSKSFFCVTQRGCLTQCDDCALTEINSLEN